MEYYHINGTKYEGEWMADYKHGKGCLMWPDGCYFIGWFAKTKKDGKGYLKLTDRETYEGDFKDDNIVGFLQL